MEQTKASGAFARLISERPDLVPVVERLEPVLRLTFTTPRQLYNGRWYVLFFKARPKFANLFGITREILFISQSYTNVEPRIFHSVDQLLSESPAQTRVEPLFFGVIAPTDVTQQVEHLLSDNAQQRIAIPFNEQEIKTSSDIEELVFSRFRRALFDRDLFDMTNPIRTDVYFFGRDGFSLRLLDAIKNSQNFALLGLRRVGKTSILFRLQRILERERIARLIYIDLESPEYHSMRWWELLGEIVKRLPKEKKRGKQLIISESNAAAIFREAAERLRQRYSKEKFVIAFDEIENISADPAINGSDHWQNDFLPFWRTLRAVQNENSNILYCVCGVNAQVIETPVVHGHDNPLFGMAGRHYVPFFSDEELNEMVNHLGGFVGLTFTSDCITYIKKRYGGHPFLVRQACSWTLNRLISEGTDRPATINAEYMRFTQEIRDRSISHHLEYVLNVLKERYPDEYALLKALGVGDLETFELFSKELPQLVDHLKWYNLIDDRTHTITLEALRDHLAQNGNRDGMRAKLDKYRE